MSKIIRIEVDQPLTSFEESPISSHVYNIPEEAYHEIRKQAIKEVISCLKEERAAKMQGMDGFLSFWLEYQQHNWGKKGGSSLAK